MNQGRLEAISERVHERIGEIEGKKSISQGIAI